MQSIAGLSFDLDYTLWSLDNVIEEAERRLWEHLSRHHPMIVERYDMDAFRGLRGAVLRQDPGIAHNLTEVRLRMLRLAARESGAPEALAEDAFQVFVEARNQVIIYEDSVAVLDQLHGRYPMLALTNGNADVHRIGLGHYFAHRITAIEVGAAKPDPAMFHAACTHAGLRPGQMLHVGDDPETDVTGAARVGMGAVWLNREGLPWPDHLEPVAHLEIRNLHELMDLLDAGPEVRS
jgi:FMN hydrolase / 5-amino-6-(5-phospho-D-ribitylamino)uracil phosphatase